MKDYQEFDGIKFTLGKDTGYYRHSTTRIYMHRYVWEFYNGKIPKGYEIHHIDFDRGNNDISNLQLVSRAEHRKIHADLLTDEQREWKRQNLNKNARPKAIEWHKSDEGTKWHSEQIKHMHEICAFKRNLICTNCGKEYVGEIHKNGGNAFCSNTCKSAYRRLHNLDSIEKTCPICGKKFLTNKYRPSQTCSRSCGNKLRHRGN